MIPKKGFSLRPVKEIINEGGHEEDYQYTPEVINAQGKVIISAKDLDAMMVLIARKLGWAGRLLSGSKTGYRNSYPKNVIIFNANLCIEEGKIWFGDIDITKSKDDLIEIATTTNRKIYVLYEMDGRFENENDPQLKKAVCVFYPEGTFEIHKDLQKFYVL